MWKFNVFHKPLSTITKKISHSQMIFKADLNSIKSHKILQNPIKEVASIQKSRNVSSFNSLKKSFTKRKLFSIIIASSILVGSYVLQDRKRKRVPMILKKPPPKTRKYKLPPTVPFLIIGAGTAAHAAARAIRADDADNRVLIVGDESYLPYMRPPLSKELWFTQDSNKVDDLVFQSFSGRFSDLFWEETGYYCAVEELMHLQHGGTAVVMAMKATNIDTEAQVVTFNDGQKVKYDKCLLATGVRGKGLDALHQGSKRVSDRVLQLRTIDDFKRLLEVSQRASSVAVVGNTPMASEIACALATKALGKNKLTVSLITPDKNVLADLLPAFLSRWATKKVKQEGVKLLEEREVVSSRYDWFSDQVVLKLNDNSEVRSDYILECVGLEANVELAAGTNIKLDEKHGGFLADDKLKAGKNIWAAGDVVSFEDPAYGRRRLEHHNNAFFTGRLAGQNMCGEDKAYWLQQTYWADLGASSALQTVGIVDSSLPTVSMFTKKEMGKKKNRKNVFEKKDEIKGVSERVDSSLVGDEGSEIMKEEEVFGERVVVNEKGDLMVKTDMIGQERVEELLKKENISVQEDELKLHNKTSASYPPATLWQTITEELEKGVVLYLKDDVVVGVLLWNVFNADQTAKNLLFQKKGFSDYAEVAKLFKLYDPAGPDD